MAGYSEAMLAPRFDLVLLRNSPLTPDELSATLALVALWRKRRWAHAADLQIIALEGLGTHRVWAGFQYTEPDRELDELPRARQLRGRRARRGGSSSGRRHSTTMRMSTIVVGVDDSEPGRGGGIGGQPAGPGP